MDGFKEFQGKDLDSAIKDACSYFDARREQLEIEILQDAKSGIFGIVGARKAKIRARRVRLRETMESVLGSGFGHGEPDASDAPSVAGAPSAADASPSAVSQAELVTKARP
ncbi:MAG: Jag N-terminal domain-containing protein, partial [Desulfovibrio sp.]|nr:Jag N-terminal domain-containing protein [Desulfovibrio sp.]